MKKKKNLKSNSNNENSIDSRPVSRKVKANIILLDRIPKLVCITLSIVSGIYVTGTIAMMIMGGFMYGDISKIFQNVVIADVVSVGVAVIGIAVSVWVGLNIYIAFSREENEKIVSDMRDELLKAEKETKELEELSVGIQRTVNNILKQNLIDTINRTSNSYIMSSYMAKLLEKISIQGFKTEQIKSMIASESAYILVTIMYEGERHSNCVTESEKARKLFERDLDTFLKQSENNTEADIENNLVEMYLNVRIADLIFYRNASCLRLKKNTGIVFCMDDMRRSIDIYKSVRKFVSEHSVEYDEAIQILSFIDNTIGYTYDLMNQNIYSEERAEEAIIYLEKAVRNIDTLWEDKAARYLRNLGLAYERVDDLNKAKDAYVKSSKLDLSDYKTWNNVGVIEIKMLEKAEGISQREITLNRFDSAVFAKYIELLKKAVNSCKIAIQICPGFMDPYYKMVQLNTYLYLANYDREKDKQEAERYIGILEDMQFEGKGFLFAYRNYLEAIGNIKEAEKINNRIGSTEKNDVDRIRELYKNEISKSDVEKEAEESKEIIENDQDNK